MEFDVQYWHWIVLGIALIVIEIFLPSFTVLWFGLGALVVGILAAIFPNMGLGMEVILWVIASCFFTLAWFKFFKPKMVDRTTAGIARESVLGETGQVIRAPVGESRGIVRFTTPLLGDDEWEFICSREVELGDRVIIVEISGNTLIVDKK